jgi:hypothetical protein
MSFVKSLISSSDHTVDSMIIGGLSGLTVFLGVTIYVVIQDYHQWNPSNFGMGFGAILGALGVGKGARDYMSPAPFPGTTTMTSIVDVEPKQETTPPPPQGFTPVHHGG